MHTCLAVHCWLGFQAAGHMLTPSHATTDLSISAAALAAQAGLPLLPEAGSTINAKTDNVSLSKKITVLKSSNLHARQAERAELQLMSLSAIHHCTAYTSYKQCVTLCKI